MCFAAIAAEGVIQMNFVEAVEEFLLHPHS